MYLIYKILKEIRYIMRSKSMKRLITLAILIVLIALLGSRVFAFDVTDENSTTYYFEDFISSNLNTSTNIDDYNVFIFEHSMNIAERYLVFFIEKQYSDTCYFYYDVNSKGKITYYLTAPSSTCKVFQAYYDEPTNQITKKFRSASSMYYAVDGGTHSLASTSAGYSFLYSTLELISYGEYLTSGYNVYLSTEEQTKGSVKLYTNYFNTEYQDRYAVSIVTNSDSAESLSIEMETETNPENSNLYRYYFDITSNGDYDVAFRYTYNDNMSLKVIRKTVSNIVTQSGTGGGGETGGETGERRSTRRRNIRTAVVEQKEEKLGAVLTIPPKTILKILMRFNRGLLTQILQSIIKHKQ